MNKFDYYLFYLLPFVFAIASNGMARCMMEGAFRYRKRKSELKAIEKVIRSPRGVILCPYSLFKPTFAPKHMLFAWILRLINCFNEAIMITLMFTFKVDHPVYRIVHLVFGCFNLLFILYTVIGLSDKHKNIDLNKSLLVRWEQLM